VSATPSIISLQGIGGTQNSQVVFKVVDTSGNPLPGKTVTFTLSTPAGGITLTPVGGISLSPTSTNATSDAGGLAATTVNSGTVNTPVRVTASTVGAGGVTLTTQSSGLTITTGIPDQDSFSLSATKLNPEFRDIDGNTTVITARLADHFNNPVPDGTAVNFTTEGGSIVGTCSTFSGACSATLTSQAPRLAADNRYTVLAYAVGEESFTDLNGSGVADLVPNELIDQNGATTDLPEAFLDVNENGVRDAGETYIDFNGNGSYDGPDGKYNGVLCDPAISSAGTCSATRAIHVRKSLVIVFSGSSAVITKTAPAGNINLGGCPAGGNTGIYSVGLRVVDSTGNYMPVGTTILVTTTDGALQGPSSFVQANTSSVPPAGATHVVNLKDDSTVAGVAPALTCTDATPAGILTVTVTSPGGLVTTQVFPIIN